KIGLYTIIKNEEVNKENESKLYTREELYKPKEIVELLRFFIDHGGCNNKKSNTHEIAADDTPNFLIKSYIFEFINDLKEAKEFFTVVNSLLTHTNNGKNSEVWKKFFTINNSKAKRCEPVYEALKTIDRVIFEMGFPFSVYTPPPSNMIVNGYDRKKKIETTDVNLRFSDCCDITIYSLFCCLLYDPTTKAYSLSKLIANGYTPSEDLRHFFEKTCTKPRGEVSYRLHQEWTHVIQDLFLSEGELMGEEEHGDNTILYCRMRDGVSAEVKTEMLNILKILARVIGTPKDEMKELGKICKMVQNSKEDAHTIKKAIKKYATNMFKKISVMNIELDINGVEILNDNNFISVYGNIRIGFRLPQHDEPSKYRHVVRFCLKHGHGKAEIESKDREMNEKDEKTLEESAEKCERMEQELGKMTANRVREFLNQGKFKPVPQEMIEKVELAQNDMKRYLEINNILNMVRMKTFNDKLYLIDIFSPYLDKMTKGSNYNREQTGNGEISNSISICSQYPQECANISTARTRDYEITANNPVVHLISNVVGSVPLDDEATQYLFVQIFASCNEKYKYLFPNIQGDVNILTEFTEFECKPRIDSEFLRQLYGYNVPNILIRLFSRLRATYKNTFYELIDKTYYMSVRFYIPMVEKCISLNHSVGIEAVKRDLRILEGRIEPGFYEIPRFSRWVNLAIKMSYCEGFKEACDSWEEILKGQEDKVEFMEYIQTNYKHRIQWNKLSEAVIKKVCTNKRHTKAMIGMYLYCGYNCKDMERAYNIFVSQFTISLCQSVINYLKNITSDIYQHLLHMAIGTSYDNSVFILVTGRREKLKFYNLYLCQFEYFVNQALEFVKGRSEFYLRPDIIEAFVAIFDNVTIIKAKLEEQIHCTEKEFRLLCEH
ncbi:hypothetical protein PAEPH01_1970, partial [Pancytospora epiphaga]